MKIIIIEDELRTANELKSIIESVDKEARVLMVLYSVSSSIQWLKENPAPELIFSDIQLGDGLSFEIFREVSVNAPIIFCTAYDQYAIQAFESNSVDYLLKPIEEAMVAKSIRKYRAIKGHYADPAIVQKNIGKVLRQMDTGYRQSILVSYRESMIPVKVVDICFVYAANGVVMLHSLDNRSYVIPHTIDQMEVMLNPELFFKTNRQFIVNKNGIRSIEHYFNRRLVLKLQVEPPVKIIVSRLRSPDFLYWIEH